MVTINGHILALFYQRERDKPIRPEQRFLDSKPDIPKCPVTYEVDEAPKARVSLSELLGGLAINKTLLSRCTRTTPILAALSVPEFN
jgi:hypothetical protein